MITARRLPNGKYVLYPDRPEETWNRRETIKQLGGEWQRVNHCWIVPESALEPLGAHRMCLVVVDAFCHMPIECRWATEAEAKAESKQENFCSLCDGRFGPVAILENFGEPPECHNVRDELWPQMTRGRQG